jgi:hypothetical protein
MKYCFYLSLLFTNYIWAQPTISNQDLLNKIEKLEQRILQLEKANNQTQKDLTQVSIKAEEAKSASALSLPNNEEEKKSFMSKLRIELKSEETKSRGPWTQKETWDSMRRNLTEFKVRKLLGNPNKIKGSLDPRIERVYHYHGDLNADGIEEFGLVNFFNGKSVSFESPHN